MYCLKCGKEIAEESRFCTYCGQKAENYRVIEKESEIISRDCIQEKANKKSSRFSVFIVVIIAALIIGGIVIYNQSYKSKDVNWKLNTIQGDEWSDYDNFKLPFEDFTITFSNADNEILEAGHPLIVDRYGKTPLRILINKDGTFWAEFSNGVVITGTYRESGSTIGFLYEGNYLTGTRERDSLTIYYEGFTFTFVKAKYDDVEYYYETTPPKL